jgi:hypothetical protein
MKNTNFSKYLGEGEVGEYTRQISSNLFSQDKLEEIYNNYFNGNISDFKDSFTSVNEVSQFLNYVIESGTDLRVIHQMVNTLS